MIVVIADDLSGATELAAVADAHGFSAEVQTEFDPGSGAEVVAVDSDSRLCAEAEAVSRVREVARRAMAAKPEWIYKKTDSVLRGHVRAEILELLAITGKTRALFVPANPGRGRVIRNGRYFVDNVPLDQTVFASDPQFPAKTSIVADLLGAAGEIEVPDVERQDDLARQAATVDGNTLCAGASEFFATFLDRPARTLPAMEPVRRISLFVCGSAAAWPARIRQCEVRAIPVFTIQFDSVATAAREISTDGAALIGIGDGQFQQSSRELEQMLAKTVRAILEAVTVERLFLEGGATAAAVLSQIKAKRLIVCGHYSKGIAAFKIPGRETPVIAIKPGSYPWSDNVWPK